MANFLAIWVLKVVQNDLFGMAILGCVMDAERVMCARMS